MAGPHTSSRLCRPLSAMVAGCLAAYALWWAWWLGNGCLAPSVFRWATHLPCPTTGLTRSLQCFLAGNLHGAWIYHPMAGVILATLAATLIPLGMQLVRRQRLRLPRQYAYLWAGVLLAAWVVKFHMPTWTW